MLGKQSILLWAALLLMLVTLASCGGSGQEKTPQQSAEPKIENTAPVTGEPEVEVNYNEDEQKVEFKSKDGTMSYEVGLDGGVTIPEGYPSDAAPLYPGGLVILAGVQSGTYTIAIQTADALDSIYDFYVENLDFVSDQILQKSEGFFLLAGKTDGMDVSVMANPDTDGDDVMNLITVIVVTAP